MENWINYEGEDKVISSFELYEKALKKNPNIKYIKSGIQSLDDSMLGFLPGDLTVISGLTGNGKTTLAKTFTDALIKSGNVPLWFQYEVTPRQFLGSFEMPIPNFYLPSLMKSGNINWIFDRIKEAKDKYNINTVFIDHLHFLADILISRNPSLDIGKIVMRIKELAIEEGLVFFLLAHTQSIKFNDETELGLGCTRDSSFIEQTSDNVFYIWRLINTENRAILKIAKNRGEGVFNKKIKLMKLGKYLVEIQDEPKEDSKRKPKHEIFTENEADLF
jgi:replicative DNA helicase